ncbi:MAG TPA: DUF6452 family protein [Prolixibacteraceae bacterium]|nr:DUF6452 family protein [Prolixibacteraceae bacterium]
MNRKSRILFLLWCAVIFFNSCTNPPCENTAGVKVNLGFYHFNGKTLKDTLIDSLSIYLVNGSSTLYRNGTEGEIDTISLPLSIVNDSSAFVFQFRSKERDTLTFRYTQYLKLVSHECGFVTYYNITGCETTRHQIDSVWVRKDLVEYGDDENIKIYF